jgi:phosphoadenosine phosphosulfate reductase
MQSKSIYLSSSQLKIPEWQELFLDELLVESRRVVKEIAEKTEKPLIIQFSGGRDSMAMLGLVREVTDNFYCSYMATGTELPRVINFVKDFCRDLGVKLLVSTPKMHKGNLFQRIATFNSFPNLGSFEGGGQRLWCCRDLKLRPAKKLLVRTFGSGTFFRLEGIRRFESERRKKIYADYTKTFMRPDDELAHSWEVFPLLNWTDDDILLYIQMKNLPTLTQQYKDYGVSGCSWCPFYSSTLYYDIIKKIPNWNVYRRIIEMENKLNQPSVHGGIFLRDIKQAVLEGRPAPVSTKSYPTKKPCTIELNGQKQLTCEVYGHLYVDTPGGPPVCFRCGQVELEKIG